MLFFDRSLPRFRDVEGGDLGRMIEYEYLLKAIAHADCVVAPALESTPLGAGYDGRYGGNTSFDPQKLLILDLVTRNVSRGENV